MRSSVSRSDRRCMCPLTRRNCLPASIIPAAHQRSAIVPSRQFLTLLACVRQIEIMLSTALVTGMKDHGVAGPVGLIAAGEAVCGPVTVRPSGTGAPGVKQGG